MSDTDTSAAGAAEGTAGEDAAAAVEADSTSTETTSPDASTVEAERSARKVREGVVTSAGMDKTIVVTITDRVRHAKYNKFVLKSKKLYTHDEANDAGVGDKVRVMETRPMSKSKRWRLVDVVERAR